VPLDSIKYYHFASGTVDGVECLIARTGYTGEDGFRDLLRPEHSEKLWSNLLEAGHGARLIALRLGRETRCVGSVYVPVWDENRRHHDTVGAA